MADEKFKYRLVPKPSLKDDETGEVKIEYTPQFSLTSPTDEPEIKDEAQEALVYYAAYLMMRTSDNAQDIQKSQVWHNLYKDVVDNYKQTKRTGQLVRMKLPDEFRRL